MKDYTITVNGKTYTGKEYPGLMCLTKIHEVELLLERSRDERS